MRVFLVVGCLAAALAPADAGAAKRPAFPEPDARRIVEALEIALRAQMTEAKSPGAAFAVVLEGEVVAALGLGVRTRDGPDPVTADTPFMIGSVTKPLTAAALLRSAEAGRLDLDGPIGRVLTGLDASVASLTPRQLLGQTSGLGDLPGAMGSSDEDALLRYARSLGPRQFVAQPGTVFSYSNPGLALAGAVLEAARHEHYADAMRAVLFAPLGMSSTTLRPAEAQAGARATGHDARGAPLAVYDLDTRLGPAGYAWSTASDLAAFVRAWLGAYQGKGTGVLSHRLARTMARKASGFPPTFDGTGYGLGLFVDDRRPVRVLHHAGEITGFSAQIVLVPERRFGLVLLMNGDSVVFTRSIDAALLALANVPPVVDDPLPIGEPVAESEGRRLAGRYLNRWPLDLVWSDGALRMPWGGALREVRRLGRGRYVVRAGAERSSPAFEIRLGRGIGGTACLLQYLWAFGREFEPAGATGSTPS